MRNTNRRKQRSGTTLSLTSGQHMLNSVMKGFRLRLASPASQGPSALVEALSTPTGRMPVTGAQDRNCCQLSRDRALSGLVSQTGEEWFI